MKLGEMDSKERMALLASLVLVGVVFVSSAYVYFNPPVQVWEGKVFDVYEGSGKTTILSYGEGKFKLLGSHDIEIGASYRITYQSRSRYEATILISIEKLDG